MFNLGMGEITVILLLALIFLGPSKLPDLASGLGKLIREIRKATSDIKSEIALDDSFRKPFEELRDAVTLHPDELKRRDQWAKDREEAAKRAAEDLAKAEADHAAGIGNVPPDGLTDDVKVDPSALPQAAPPAAGPLPGPVPGPNDTIVQTAPPRGATLDDIPTPPPDATAAKPGGRPPGLPPAGTVARVDGPLFGKPPGAATAVAPPPEGSSNLGGSNVTQILSEKDLIPSSSGGRPPPPPHLPGLRPALPPPGVTPPVPSEPKKS